MGSFKLGTMTLGGLFKKRDGPLPLREETGSGRPEGACRQRRGDVHPLQHLRAPMPDPRHRGRQEIAHLVHQPLPVRPVRLVRPRMPQALPRDGHRLCAACDEDRGERLRGPRAREMTACPMPTAWLRAARWFQYGELSGDTVHIGMRRRSCWYNDPDQAFTTGSASGPGFCINGRLGGRHGHGTAS